jgi:ABC-type amino acid transport substrate-binding protein
VSLTRRALLLGGLAAVAAGRAAAARTLGDTVNTVGHSLDELRAKGSLRVAFYTDFFPFSYEAEGGGGWRGIDLDLARHVAGKLGLRHEPFPLQAGETVDDDLRNAIWRGRTVDHQWANLMVHVPYDRALMLRNELVVLTAPYHVEGLVLAADPDRVEGEAGLGMLEGRKVAVELDSLADLYLSGAQGGRLRDGLVRRVRPADAVAALVAGEADAAMGSRSQVEALLGQNRGRFELLEIPLPGLPVPSWRVGFAVRENARDLGYAVGDIVDEALRDGTVAGIFAAHGATHKAPQQV